MKGHIKKRAEPEDMDKIRALGDVIQRQDEVEKTQKKNGGHR